MVAPAPVELRYTVSPSHARWVLEEEDVPESPLHDAIIRLLVEVLLAWAQRTGLDALIGSNVALRWDEDHPAVGVDPDVYLVAPPPPEGESAGSLCTWRAGHHAPRVAVEVVSEHSAEKDYGEGPEKYAASGTRELWVFDPRRFGPATRGGPFVLQVWRRVATRRADGTPGRGRFQRVYAGDGPAFSRELGAWLVVTDEGSRLRLSDDAAGARPWPTASERERAEKERERAEKERERAEKEAALARLAELEATLAALRGRGDPER